MYLDHDARRMFVPTHLHFGAAILERNDAARGRNLDDPGN